MTTRDTNLHEDQQPCLLKFGETYCTARRRHERPNPYYGYYAEWDNAHPINLMGHSMGGTTILQVPFFLNEKSQTIYDRMAHDAPPDRFTQFDQTGFGFGYTPAQYDANATLPNWCQRGQASKCLRLDKNGNPSHHHFLCHRLGGNRDACNRNRDPLCGFVSECTRQYRHNPISRSNPCYCVEGAETYPLLTDDPMIRNYGKFHGKAVISAHTIVSPLDGSTWADAVLSQPNVQYEQAMDYGKLSTSRILTNWLYNFDLDHWGMNRHRGERPEAYWQRLCASHVFDTTDAAPYDLTTTGSMNMNWIYREQDTTFYFSTSASCTIYADDKIEAGPGCLLGGSAEASVKIGNHFYGGDDPNQRHNDGTVNLANQRCKTNTEVGYSSDCSKDTAQYCPPDGECEECPDGPGEKCLNCPGKCESLTRASQDFNAATYQRGKWYTYYEHSGSPFGRDHRTFVNIGPDPRDLLPWKEVDVCPTLPNGVQSTCQKISQYYIDFFTFLQNVKN